MKKPRWLANVLLSVIVIAVFPGLAFAGLGDNVNSIPTDQARMKASARITQSTAYSVTELTSPNGTVVREYVSPAGKVFAVAWQGQALPDLRQVLGSYFDQYVQLMHNRRARGPAVIRTPNLVVQVGGHQRALSGRAYDPRLVPSGVKAEVEVR